MQRFAAVLLIVSVMLIAPAANAKKKAAASQADQTLSALLDGNKRYVAGKPQRPHQNAGRRAELSKGQKPRAAVLGCADSRVPPELLFDQGLGDIFVVRVAGNIVDDVALGSLEYAAEHLGVDLIIVLGHSSCGAVAATLKGGEAPGHLGALVKAIKPAVDECRGKPGDALDNAVHANVRRVVAQISSSKPVLGHLVKEGTLKVVGAHYDITTGAVTLVPETASAKAH